MKNFLKFPKRYSVHLVLIIAILFSIMLYEHVFAQDRVSIYDIQYTTDPSGNSPLLGQTVSITGTVTGLFFEGYTVSDNPGPWNSIFVNDYTEAPSLFQEVELTGTVIEYYGWTFITEISNYSVLSDNVIINATTVTANEASSEMYESVLICINNVQVISLESNGEWMIEDATGTLRCDDWNDYMYFPQVGHSLTSIQGILFYTFNNFKLEPRFTNDITSPLIPHYALKGDVVTMNENFDILPDTYLEILGDRIIGIQNTPPVGIQVTDVEGFIFPGFIDSHNHPSYNVLDIIPFDQIFYHRNEWRSTDLHQEVHNQRYGILNYGGAGIQATNVDKLAEIRALCSGATMMQGYNCNGHSFDPTARAGIGINNAERFPSMVYSSTFPLWEPASFWQSMSEENWKRFVIHIAEGTNQTALDEFAGWKNLAQLDGRTTIIHGTALTQQKFAEMAEVHAHLIFSPKSNWMLYENTTDIPAALTAGVNVALAPDWTPSGERDILGEVKFADRLNKAIWGDIITPQQFASFITSNAAEALGIHDRVGTIAPEYQADLVVLPELYADPYQTLMEVEPEDIKLTVVNGRPMYGDPSLMYQFPFLDNLENVNINGVDKKIGISVESHAIPESEKTLGEIVSELEAAYDASDPKVCRFLNYAMEQDFDWEFQESGTVNNLFSIDAFNENIIWAAGSNGKIIRTTNGGDNWDLLSIISDSLYFQTIEALNSTVAVAGGYFDSVSISQAKIYHSENGGASWNCVYSQDSGKINNITMFDNNTGYAIGDPVAGKWTVLHTTDGGINWEQMESAPMQSNNESGFYGSVVWIDNLSGWFGTNNSKVYHTTDGANSWTGIEISDIQNISHLSFTNYNVGLIAGDGKLARSTNNGISWQLIQKPGYGVITLLNNNQGIFWAGDAGTCLYYSQDNGTTWNLSNIAGFRLRDISFYSSENENAWIVGHAGIVFKSNSIIIDVPEETNNTIETELLKQNVPNPFKSATKIQYVLPVPAQVNIDIYNLLGKKVAELVNAEKSAGYHEIEFDASDFPGGVYIYTLKTHYSKQSRKLIKLP